MHRQGLYGMDKHHLSDTYSTMLGNTTLLAGVVAATVHTACLWAPEPPNQPLPCSVNACVDRMQLSRE